MYHVLHITPAAYYLLLGGLLFNQTSCITVTDRVIPGSTLRQYPQSRHRESLVLTS